VFLTGESRTWNPKLGAFNRVVPLRPLKLKPGDGDRGFGAVEVGVRYSYLDLSDKLVRAGRLQSVTLGLNWYMNTSAKMQFNYDYAHRGDTNNPAQGHVHSLGTRMAFDF
jgi:phosphate-selective porin OprO/OprP